MATDDQILLARTHLASAKNVTVLTGAGISADSGVPTFRGADGLWRNFRAEDLATPEAFERDPRLVWEWYNWRRELIATKQPNPAHVALVELERRTRDTFWLITQNVDGLHRTAGSQRLIRNSRQHLESSLYGLWRHLGKPGGPNSHPADMPAMSCAAPASYRLVWGIALGGRSAPL